MEDIYKSESPEKIGQNYESTLRAYIGKNSDYYIEQFKRIENGEKVNFNWVGFFIGGAWLIYRKMYSYFFLLMLVPVYNIILIINLIFKTNKIYYKALCKKIENDKLTGKDINNQENVIEIAKKHGGTNFVGVIVLLVLAIGSAIFSLMLSLNNDTNNYYDSSSNSLINNDTDYSVNQENVNSNQMDELVSMVYNSYFTYYSEEETIGEAFDNFFINTQWELNIVNDISYVNFFGTIINPNNNQPLGAAGAMFQLLDDDSFELIEAYFGDEELVGDDIDEFLEIIYNN
jgi:hypothetical protein